MAVICATLMVLLYFQAALYTPPFYKQRQFEDSIGGRLQHIIEQNAPHRSFLVLSPGIYPFWPMVNYVNGRMTTRFLTMWVLQGVYATCDDFPALYNPPDTMGDSEKFVFDTVSEDFAREHPDLLIVDRIAGVPRCQGKEFDYLEYFLQNRVFADAFENYRTPHGLRPLPDLPAEEEVTVRLTSSRVATGRRSGTARGSCRHRAL